ncbi:antitoxin MazE5 [Flexivirga sp.]|uniref:antitoxin MazE5 n=1 Tax=Flexivirga sp. TaxID=1962927 RepID=UPI003F7E2342
MPRSRISTTVDSDLLAAARASVAPAADAALMDAALRALLAGKRRAEIDAAYDLAYSSHPVDEPDAWGDLASFRAAASKS